VWGWGGLLLGCCWGKAKLAVHTASTPQPRPSLYAADLTAFLLARASCGPGSPPVRPQGPGQPGRPAEAFPPAAHAPARGGAQRGAMAGAHMLVLDSAVRDWVFIPLTLFIVLMKLVMQYMHQVGLRRGEARHHGGAPPRHTRAAATAAAAAAAAAARAAHAARQPSAPARAAGHVGRAAAEQGAARGP
jgi:hypothetical protein